MRRILVCAIVVAAFGFTSYARADSGDKTGFRGWGPRIGLTANPDQFHFGAHADFGNFGEHVRVQPSLEVGLGDNLTVFAINLDAQYRFASRWDVWTPYLGGGPGIFFVSVDSNGKVDGASDTDIGLSAVGGIEKGLANGSRFFIEGRLGFVDAPDFKATAGWTFFH